MTSDQLTIHYTSHLTTPVAGLGDTLRSVATTEGDEVRDAPSPQRTDLPHGAGSPTPASTRTTLLPTTNYQLPITLPPIIVENFRMEK
ncbi:hypothetical protein H6G17_15395 [Chroococcidiopsis sp. FACHB-1243]|uniref:hypothetical protein n=1 Tax=Chroococcidiopsis sp. [FACHB-1243] TaxID=2692781 RepID=UPI00177C9D46|nr:hypothetical protein [Chroococcidiopsis sp. [FACHB-1243]]MBD2306885.1 hypothetical protein [Chroococcidiopsis sp. [FACHB-1243]]